MVNRIKKCLVGEKYTDEISELNALGIETISLPKNPFLDDEINEHADILSFNCGDGRIYLDSSIIGEISGLLTDYRAIPCKLIKSPYPNDVKLNAALLGDKLVCNKKTVSNELLKWANDQNKQIINTKQGYTKCNMCILNDNAVITEDGNIACLLKNYQYNVLKLQPGYVALSKAHYGFIGGACAKISDREIYFSGDISSHPDFLKISSFLNMFGFNMIYNSNRPLKDFGGIVSI